MDILCYNIEGIMYVNLTNKCSNDCDFCERNRVKTMSGYNLWLDKEPTSDEIIEDLKSKDLNGVTDLVFCGFGEPSYRWNVIKSVADFAHSIGLKTRMNTNGQGSLINGYDITVDIDKYLDKVNISLNNSNRDRYDDVCHSIYGKEAFEELLSFAQKCSEKGVHTTLSVVDCIGADEIEECRKIANSLGVNFRVRQEIK